MGTNNRLITKTAMMFSEAITPNCFSTSLYVSTKVTEENAKADDFARSLATSLETLGLDYVDQLLIHWPQPAVPLEETLGALAKAKREGLARHVGVSNFTVALLDEAVAKCSEPIVTNQNTSVIRPDGPVPIHGFATR